MLIERVLDRRATRRILAVLVFGMAAVSSVTEGRIQVQHLHNRYRPQYGSPKIDQISLPGLKTEGQVWLARLEPNSETITRSSLHI